MGAADSIHQGDQVTPLRYFFGMYRIYRASAHGVLFSFLQAWRDASARVQF